ncbi:MULTISPECIES: SagB family peptide dehydrogenase [unclassified Borrelia]|uniref:SagB family peptide dehydrogenase n=1 Tax=unclassified Borrelia TaxID=2649934 RepID=UPI001E5F7A69|nr:MULTISPECIES: SagB family peptide dehydrogenase [unclassified Borrelia]UGQ16587.1 SagB family peptide dehydrogenase [Borrelia sp. RT5S]UGQ17743.1 SagB family peptide dehydrogenase [Borrelia sp. RT1S]
MKKNDNGHAEVLKLAAMHEMNNITKSVFNSNIVSIPSNSRLQFSLFDKEDGSLALEYLLNFSENKKSHFNETISRYLQDPAIIANTSRKESREFDENIVYLPKVKRLKIKLEEALYNRKSSRSFKSKKLSMVNLSTVLYYSVGDTRYEQIELGAFKIRQARRTYPSGGGLYPIDIYFYVNGVEHLDNGFYLYQPSNNSVFKMGVSLCEIKELINIAFFKDSVNFNVAFFFVYRYEVNYLKYSEMSLIFAFIELGAIHQNLALVSTALNLGYCNLGGFDKVELEKILKLDGISDHVVSASVLGNI